MEEIKIESLGLTTKAQNVLKKNGINTIEDLIAISLEELISIKGLELLTIRDIAKEVYNKGYCFYGITDLKTYEKNIVLKHKEKTANSLRKIIMNATPMPVYDEEEFNVLIEELYNKDTKSINPLSEKDTYYFREYLGINQIIYNDGEILKLDPIYRVNKNTYKNMVMIRIIYSRFDNNELENEFNDTQNRFSKPMLINGIKIESYDDFSKISSIDFYEEFYESTARFRFYLTYKNIHDRGIYFHDEIEEPKKEIVDDASLDKEIKEEKIELEKLQEKLNQSILLKKLLMQLLEETDEEIKSITNDISNIKPKI